MIQLTYYSAVVSAIGLFFLGVVMCLLIQTISKLVDARKRLAGMKDQLYEIYIEKGQIIGKEGYLPVGKKGRNP